MAPELLLLSPNMVAAISRDKAQGLGCEVVRPSLVAGLSAPLLQSQVIQLLPGLRRQREGLSSASPIYRKSEFCQSSPLKCRTQPVSAVSSRSNNPVCDTDREVSMIVRDRCSRLHTAHGPTTKQELRKTLNGDEVSWEPCPVPRRKLCALIGSWKNPKERHI